MCFEAGEPSCSGTAADGSSCSVHFAGQPSDTESSCNGGSFADCSYHMPARSTPPRRTNLLSGAVLNEGNEWNSGYLEGEDSCADSSDFALDFDDRGMGGNPSDGTDWGMADGSRKCGSLNSGDAWFVWYRPAADSHGGSCEPCPKDHYCEEGRIEPCPDRTTSRAGSTSIADCVSTPCRPAASSRQHRMV